MIYNSINLLLPVIIKSTLKDMYKDAFKLMLTTHKQWNKIYYTEKKIRKCAFKSI